MLTAAEKRQLDDKGYLVLDGLMGRELLNGLRARVEELFLQEGDRAGSEFKQEPNARRLANLVNKGEIFEQAIQLPQVIECMAHVLGPDFKLSSLNVRAAGPFCDCSQPLHADSGAIADEHGYWVANSVWMLDDFTTRTAPSGWCRAPTNGAACPRMRSRTPCASPRRSVAHRRRRHRSRHECTPVARCHSQPHRWPRRAMHAFYTRRDKPQQQYQKKLLSSERAGPPRAEPAQAFGPRRSAERRTQFPLQRRERLFEMTCPREIYLACFQ